MSVEAQTVEYIYLGDGVTTSFPFSSRFLQPGDILVGVNGTPQTTGFTVTGAGSPTGGNVVFSSAPASGAKVVLLRKPPISQLVDFVNGQTVLEGVLDTALDKACMIDQYLLRAVGKSLRVPDLDTTTPTEDLELPAIADRKNKYLFFDAYGKPIGSSGSGSIPAAGSVGPEQIAVGSAWSFNTKADLESSAVAAPVMFVQTLAYFASGGGAATYSRKPVSGLTMPGDVTAADGSVWQIADPIVSPRQFGARGDFRQLTVATTVGSQVVTAVSGAFSKSDEGRQITVNTGTGSAERRTISVFTSASQVTVSSAMPASNSAAPAYIASIDTQAVQACLDFCAVSNAEIYLETGVYLVSGVITCSSALTMRGAGPHVSGFVLDSGSTALQFRAGGSAYTLPYEGVMLENFSVRSGYEANTSAGLIDYDSDMTGSPQRYVMLNNINVNTLGVGFDCGVLMWNASNFSFRDVQIAGYGNIRAGSIGLRVCGDTKPIDMYCTGLKAYFLDTAVKIEGDASFTKAMEAVVFEGCVLIVNNTCIDFSSATAVPYLGVMDCNLNGYKCDIKTLNVVQIKIDNNLFYSCDRTPHEAVWSGIQINYNDNALPNDCDNTITNNTFSGANTPSTSRYAITVAVQSAKNVSTDIGGNRFLNCDYGVLTFSDVTGVKVADSNTFRSVAAWAAFTTPVGNIDATGVLGSTGRFGGNLGQCVRYGTVSANVGAGNRINVVYPSAMQSTTRTVMLTIGSAALASAFAVDSKTAAGFSVYFPGITIGTNVTFDYYALGE